MGYKTPEEAARAVKYFDRSYIRLSRLSVEIARPVSFKSPRLRVLANPGSRSTMQLRLDASLLTRAAGV